MVIFVNINEDYVDTGNAGTESDPLNWLEFYDRIRPGGVGAQGDVYKLRGIRFMGGAADGLFGNIQVAAKNFTIQEWCLSSYGPWVIVPKALYEDVDYNYSIDLSNALLANGIIYTVPTSNGEGGVLKVGACYNIYLVDSGKTGRVEIAPVTGSFVVFDPYGVSATTTFDTEARINGCTFFTGAGITDSSATGSYTLFIQDSVFANFVSASVSTHAPFSSAYAYIEWNAFQQQQSDVEGMFSNIESIDQNQYEWNPPSDFPFRKGNTGYLETIDWILNNKSVLAPFSGITTPPNPGVNAPNYQNYETGLFGYSRANYTSAVSDS